MSPRPTPAPNLTVFSEHLARILLLVFAFTLPLYFDLTVPEVSGDIRWAATTLFAGLTGLVLLLGRCSPRNGPLKLAAHGPALLWVAAGLALWVGVSMIDALNPYRGIILIKALLAQLMLMVCVWWVATPRTPQDDSGGGFARALLWALTLPISITAFLGILQFHGFNQASFDAAIGSSPYLVFQPLLWLVGGITGLIGPHIPGWPQAPGLIDQLTGFFLQSAVPGGTFANKNLAGSYTAMMIPLILYLFLSARRWWERGLASGLLALALLFLIYARARASWLALLGALAVMLVLVVVVPSLRHAVCAWVWPRARLWKLLGWSLIPLIVLVVHSGDRSPIVGAHGIDRSPLEQMAALGSAAGGWNEYGGRLAYNLNSMVITKDHWFNGVGIGNFFGIYPAYHDALVSTPSNSYNVLARPQRTHTDVMQAFTELGIPGGMLYVGLFALSLWMGLRLAGPQAGSLGIKLIGMGLLGGITALTLFLYVKDLLRLPGLWHWLFVAALLGALGFLMLRWFQAARAVQRETVTPLTEWQLAGWFGSLGLLTICLNAFLDFPMQLPTAPAAALMLAGLILALHGTLYPSSLRLGWKRTLTLPRLPVLAVIAALLAAAWAWALYDAHHFRNGNRILKAAMGRIYAGVVDDLTLDLINRAQAAYSLDPRIHENLGVVYANYRGNRELPRTERIAMIEWVVSMDPWGANQLVSLAGQYIAHIEESRARGDVATANATMQKLKDLGKPLMRTAPFSHLSWSVQGLTALLDGRPAEAIPLLQRALTIEPTYWPAQNGLRISLQLTGQQPLIIEDSALRRRPTGAPAQ